jgi:hypothetical protein
MGKKNSGGKKFKSNKKGASSTVVKLSASALAMITPDNETTFAGVITRPFGDCKFGVKNYQGNDFKVGLPGSLKKGKRTQVGDMVFFEISSLMKSVDGHILHVYNDVELSELELIAIRIDDEVAKTSSDVVFTNEDNIDDFEFAAI